MDFKKRWKETDKKRKRVEEKKGNQNDAGPVRKLI